MFPIEQSVFMLKFTTLEAIPNFCYVLDRFLLLVSTVKGILAYNFFLADFLIFFTLHSPFRFFSFPLSVSHISDIYSFPILEFNSRM